MTAYTPLPGDANAVRTYGTRYETVAERILAVSRTLDDLASTERSQGDSIDALKEKSKDTALDIRKAQPRYHETALALVEFSVDLADAQQKANSAISDASNGNDELDSLKYRRRQREEDRLDALMRGDEQDEIDRIQRDVRSLDTQIDQAEYALSQSANRYNEAVRDLEDAVNQAIDRIAPALDQLNDSFGDYVAAAFESVAEFAAAISKWIADVLTALITAILLTVIALIVLVVAVLLILVLFALLAIVLTLVMLVIVPLAIAAIKLILVVVALLVVRSVAREALAPTPDLKRTELRPQNQFARDPGEGEYSNIFTNNGMIDTLGGTESTEIEIVTVRDEDGNVVGYRVVLPSTQDWEEATGLLDTPPVLNPQGDQGALNDLGSNIALMTMPMGTYGPYERAVWAALEEQMRIDGAPRDTPIMMTGFSQGGILAARMAADPNHHFNITAVVTAGSCVDTFDIPGHVSVISLQHDGDPVTILDGDIEGDNNIANPDTNPYSNQVTITAQHTPPMAVHGADSYAATAAQVLDNSQNEQVQRIQEEQAMFFTDNETFSIYSGSE